MLHLYISIERGDKMAEWMTVEEAAEYLKCSRSTIYRRIKEGELKLYKAGKLSRLKREDLDNLFNEDEE